MQVEQADFNYEDFNSEQSEADKSLLVRFYIKSIQDKTKSAAEGRPIFKEVEYIEIRYAGNRTDAVARPARVADKSRFPRHYDAFKKRVELPEEGTPLAEWPVVTRSQVEELAYLHIKTVEQLASVNDSNSGNLMGFATLRQKAKTFIEAGKAGVDVAEMHSQLKERDTTIDVLQSQVDMLKAQVDKLCNASEKIEIKDTPDKADGAEEQGAPASRRRTGRRSSKTE